MLKTFSTFLIISFIIAPANAQTYERKKVLPNYFMPKKDIDNTEKLENSKRPQAQFDAQESKKALITQQKTFEKSPEYTQIYDEYIKDINYIAKNKKYPDTSLIQQDYADMNTNQQFLVK